jgi:DNA-binding LacI/PurR family transcriptional regulator
MPIDRSKNTLAFAGQGQVHLAIKRIVQWVHRFDLKSGDQLPNHQALAKSITVSNDTLSAAMARLMQLGLVSRRARAGTILLDPHAADDLQWTIGLATIPAPRQGQSSFFSELHYRLQIEIARRGWRSVSYFRFNQQGQPQLNDFGSLLQDVNQSSMDALLFMTSLRLADWNRVRSTGIIPYHAPFDTSFSDSLLLDHPGMIRQAFASLVDRGAKSIGLASGRSLNRCSQPVVIAMEESMRRFGWPAERAQIYDAVALEGGFDLADQILARPESRRPDGWIVLDDFVAYAMATRFESRRHRPDMAVCVNTHNPLRFPRAVLEFHVNVGDLVDKLIECLHRRLLNPATEPSRGWFPLPLKSTLSDGLSPARIPRRSVASSRATCLPRVPAD